MRKYLAAIVLTLVLGTSIPQAHATNYFVSASTGNDSNSGTSPTTPWKTVGKVNGFSFATSDNVYFLAGDDWENSFLTVGWSGTASAPVTVGSYYVNGSGQTVYGAGPGNLRPVINDNYKWGSDPMANTPACTGCNPGINITGSYVNLSNIEISQSGYGVQTRGTTNVTISNVFVNGAFQCGIDAERVTNFTVQNSEIFNAEDFRNPATFNQGGNWCTDLGVQQGTNILIQGNYIHEGWGEGTIVYNGSRNATIRNNVYYAHRSVSIYLGAMNTASVYGNMVFGTANKAFWHDPDAVSPGITIENEPYLFYGCTTTSCGNPGAPGTGSLCPLGVHGNYTGNGQATLCPDVLQNVEIHDNLVADTATGFAAWGSTYFDGYTNIKVYNNTFVDNDAQIGLSNEQPLTNFVVQNNIFLTLTSGLVDFSGTNKGATFNTNYWSQGAPKAGTGTAIASATDVYSGAKINMMSGWRNITASNQVEAQSFAPVAGSSTLGKGSSANLYFDTDYYGDNLDSPVDLGAIAGYGRTSAAQPCTFNGQTVADGQSVTAYLAASVPSGQTCQSQTRTCSNGTLSGTYTFASCSVSSTPPLIVASVSPNPAHPGQTVTVTATINAGITANGAMTAMWFTDSNGRYLGGNFADANYVAGQTTTVNVTFALPSTTPTGTTVNISGVIYQCQGCSTVLKSFGGYFTSFAVD